MTSKTKIEKRLQKKTNPRLRRLLILLKKQKQPIWHEITKELAKPRRKSVKINLYKLNKFSKEHETIIVPGKILSAGTLNKQINIAAFSFSQSARQKIKASGSKIVEFEDLFKSSEKNIKLIK